MLQLAVFNSSKSPAGKTQQVGIYRPGRRTSPSSNGLAAKPVLYASALANQDGFDDQNVPEGRVARAFRRQRGDGARELVRDGGAVIRGAQGTRGEPRDAGAVLSAARGAGERGQLRPSDRGSTHAPRSFSMPRTGSSGIAPARVGTEFGVQIRRHSMTRRRRFGPSSAWTARTLSCVSRGSVCQPIAFGGRIFGRFSRR